MCLGPIVTFGPFVTNIQAGNLSPRLGMPAVSLTYK
jgi:hypothetical protein